MLVAFTSITSFQSVWRTTRLNWNAFVMLHLPDTFDIFGYENLLPSRPGANLQKASLVLDVPHTHFFMGLASSKRKSIEEHLAKIERRNVRGKALILLQQCLERGELDPSEVIKRVRQNLLHVAQPHGMGHQLIEVARADFNGDGLEDILLFEYCYATHGTLGFGSTRVLTRKTKEGSFEPV